MAADEGCAHQLVGRALPHRLAGIALLGPQHGDVEHRGARDIVPVAERNLLGRSRIAVTVLIAVEVGSDHQIGRIGADLRVDPVLEKVPAASSGIETRGVLRRNVREVEDLLVHRPRTSPFGRAEHVALVAAAARRFAVVLDTRRDIGIGLVGIRPVSSPLVAGMARSGHPDRAVVFGTEADRVVAGLVAADRQVGAEVVGIVIVAVRLLLGEQLGPSRVLGRPGNTATVSIAITIAVAVTSAVTGKGRELGAVAQDPRGSQLHVGVDPIAGFGIQTGQAGRNRIALEFGDLHRPVAFSSLISRAVGKAPLQARIVIKRKPGPAAHVGRRRANRDHLGQREAETGGGIVPLLAGDAQCGNAAKKKK